MIDVTCDNCFNDLNVPGGLLFGAPQGDGVVKKYHLCKACIERIVYKLGSI